MSRRIVYSDRPRGSRPCAGFSLVELMVTLTILAVVLGILSAVVLSTNRANRRTAARADIQAASRQVLLLLTTELRQAGADPKVPPAGIVGIVSADSTSVRVRADLNADGVIQTAEPSEDVTYTYDANAQVLLRNPGSGAVAALTNVISMRFSYFDAANQPLATLPLNATDRALTRSIGVTLTCLGRDSNPLTNSTRITLRNQGS